MVQIPAHLIARERALDGIQRFTSKPSISMATAPSASQTRIVPVAPARSRRSSGA
jgi:hypothetical protein